MQYGQSIHEKYCNGDSLTDQELKDGIVMFTKAYQACSDLGPIFRLAAKEAGHVAMRLEEFQRARKNK